MCTPNTNENKMNIEQITTQKQRKKIKTRFFKLRIMLNIYYILIYLINEVNQNGQQKYIQ